jgi:hypothetical protein
MTVVKTYVIFLMETRTDGTELPYSLWIHTFSFSRVDFYCNLVCLSRCNGIPFNVPQFNIFLSCNVVVQ